MFSRYFVHDTMEQRRAEYQRGLEITKEVEQLEEELSHLDLFWLEEQRRQISVLEKQIRALEEKKTKYTEEKTTMENRIHSLEYEVLPELYQELSGKEDTLTERFSSSFIETVGLPRYQQEFARLKKASAVAKNFGDRLVQTENERNNAQQKLREARAEYVSAFQPCSFRTDAMTNEEFDRERQLMEGEGGLFAMPFQQKYGPLIEELFGRLAMSDDTQLNARKQSELQQNIERYTDFRTYLKFDLETTVQNGSKQLLSQTLNTKSGGETQTPFYIAVLASFAQLYQVNNLLPLASNTVRLVVFDEAFNKMDSDRIIESVRLLRKMGLQAIICTPPDKLPDIMPLADKTLLVLKDKYQMHILPWKKEMA